MSNFQCESCGAVYIDNGITGYETKQCKTTADVIKGLNERIVLLQNMNKSLNELLSIKDEAITDLTADKIELKEQLCAKEKELCNVYMEVNAANTAAAGNLSLSQLAEDKLQAAVNQYNAVVQQNKELQQELIQTKEKIKPFADEYFSGLTYSEIAELAKKSIRLTKEHCSDLRKIEIFETALQEISTNSDCVCSLDDTCQPMRIAANALAKGGKNE